MRTHIVSLNETETYGDNTYYSVDVLSPTKYLTVKGAKHNRRARFEVMVPEDTEERGFMIPQAVVIADSPVKRGRTGDAEIGDHIVAVLPTGEVRKYEIMPEKALNDPTLRFVEVVS